jgi:hypothetical protein
MAMRFPGGAFLLPVTAIAAFSTLSVVAAQETVAIPVESESHHHVVLENSYVRVLFVEIPPHESTLLHHHDLPYVSIPPGGADAMPLQVEGAAQPGTRTPGVGYAVGGFSHVVTNSSDVMLQNIAVELIHAQGKARNRCEPAVRGQPWLGICEPKKLDAFPFYKLPAFETDESLVEGWSVRHNFTSHPLKVSRGMLVAGLTGVTISAGGETDSEKAPHGILWIPARSKMVLRTTPESNGHFYSITFKDSAPSPH